jgi:hypothetical protein
VLETLNSPFERAVGLRNPCPQTPARAPQCESNSYSELKLEEKPFSSVRPGEWDDFVLSTGGSFLGAWKIVRARRLAGRVRLFEFFAENGSSRPPKIAQVALLTRRSNVVFLDRIHLSPANRNLRALCFQKIVQRFGAGTYRYGSQWNCEEPFEWPAIPGFAIEPVRNKRFQINLVDLKDWGDFHSYFRNVSENIRRDYKKGRSASAEIRTGSFIGAFRDLFALSALRGYALRKDNKSAFFLEDCAVHALKLLVLGKDGIISTVRSKGKCYSAFFGTQFGDSLFYNAGGTLKNSQGLGSLLFVSLIEKWFAEHPNGRIFLGKTHDNGKPTEQVDGDLLYRRKLRACSVSGFEFEAIVHPSSS